MANVTDETRKKLMNAPVRKSNAKRMGVKAVLHTNGKVGVFSFAEHRTPTGKKVPHLEKLTDRFGEELFADPKLFATSIDEELITFRRDLFDDSKRINPYVRPQSDYIGIKSELETKYFGRTFDEDNLHIQIAYNISDIKKILLPFINNIVYLFYNLQKNTEQAHSTDVIGLMPYYKTMEEQRIFCEENNKTIYADAMSLVQQAKRYHFYFPNAFRSSKKGQNHGDDEYNFNILRLLSMVRQICEHELRRNSTTSMEEYLYRSQGVNTDLVTLLDTIFASAVEKTNNDFLTNAQNNLYILKKVYPESKTLERDYYNFTVRKEQLNVGVNMKTLREIMLSELPSVRNKQYDTYRSKIYTVFDFILFDTFTKFSLQDEMIERLRLAKDEEEKFDVYNEYATILFAKIGEIWKKTLSLFEEEAGNKFKSKYEIKDKSYFLDTDVSYFAKLIFFVTLFLDGKEINKLLCAILSRFENLSDLTESATACGITLHYVGAYESAFADPKKIADEIRLIKNIARMKPETDSVPSFVLYDAAKLLGIRADSVTLGDEEREEGESLKEFMARISETTRPTKYNKEKKNHQLRNFLINNVTSSRWFFYIMRYYKAEKCRKLMRNRAVLSFVLNEIPDTQIKRYYQTITGMEAPYDLKYAREVIVDKLVGFSFQTMANSIEQMSDSEYKQQKANSEKEKQKAIVGLYLTVCYLIVKNLVDINSRLSIAFCCQERDTELLLDNTDEKNHLALTKFFVKRDEDLTKQYFEERNKIRDSKLSEEEKQKAYDEILLPIEQKKHYSLKYDKLLTKNLAEAEELDPQNRIHRTYRNHVAHLAVIEHFESYLDEVGTIGSYYQLYAYVLQRILLESTDSDKAKALLATIKEKKSYSKDLLWLLNLPFAYNLARYKAMSIEDVFYGKIVEKPKKAPPPKKEKKPVVVLPKAGDVVTICQVKISGKTIVGLLDGMGVTIPADKVAKKYKRLNTFKERTLKVKLTKVNEYNGKVTYLADFAN